MGTTQRSSQAAPPDSYGPHAHLDDCDASNNILLSLLNTAPLAALDSLSHILPPLFCWYRWRPCLPIRVVAQTSCLVALCLLLPCTSPPNSRTSFYQEVYLWLSSSWNHIAWRLCFIRNRGIGILPAISRHHQYTFDPRFQLPHSTLSRLRFANGSCISLV